MQVILFQDKFFILHMSLQKIYSLENSFLKSTFKIMILFFVCIELSLPKLNMQNHYKIASLKLYIFNRINLQRKINTSILFHSLTFHTVSDRLKFLCQRWTVKVFINSFLNTSPPIKTELYFKLAWE